jgi:hypothetical protein
MATARLAVIGDNNPPEPTRIEAAREQLADIETEASAWFDGADIENDAQADEVSRIIDAARKAKTRFDNDRKVEKQPHMDAGKAVDDAWKPLTSAADRIVEVAKGVLTPWLLAKDAEKRAREAAEREKAEAAAAEARRLAAENDGSLAAAKARDAAIEEARIAEARALAAERDKAGAKGVGMARTVSLRTTWKSDVTDRRALLNHIAKTHPDDLSDFLTQWAAQAVRTGARDLPGVHVYEEKVAA